MLQVLTTESERQSAEEWFKALDPITMPLLAVLPNGEICVCWNSTFTDDDAIQSPYKHQESSMHDNLNTSPQHPCDSNLRSNANSNSNGLALVEIIEERTGEDVLEASEATQMHAAATQCPASDAESVLSSSIFLHGQEFCDAAAQHEGHASTVLDLGGTHCESHSMEGRPVGVNSRGFGQEMSPDPVLVPQNSSSGTHNTLKSFCLWATPFSGVQRSLSSFWQDSASQMDSAKHSTERAWLQEEDIELPELPNMHGSHVTSTLFSQMHELAALRRGTAGSSPPTPVGDSSMGGTQIANSSIRQWLTTSESHSTLQPGEHAGGTLRAVIGSTSMTDSSGNKSHFRSCYQSAHSSTTAWHTSESDHSGSDSEYSSVLNQHHRDPHRATPETHVSSFDPLEPGQFSHGALEREADSARTRTEEKTMKEVVLAAQCSRPGEPAQRSAEVLQAVILASRYSQTASAAAFVPQDLNGQDITQHTAANSTHATHALHTASFLQDMHKRISSGSNNSVCDSMLPSQEPPLTCAPCMHEHPWTHPAVAKARGEIKCDTIGKVTPRVAVPPLRTSCCKQLRSSSSTSISPRSTPPRSHVQTPLKRARTRFSPSPQNGQNTSASDSGIVSSESKQPWNRHSSSSGHSMGSTSITTSPRQPDSQNHMHGADPCHPCASEALSGYGGSRQRISCGNSSSISGGSITPVSRSLASHSLSAVHVSVPSRSPHLDRRMLASHSQSARIQNLLASSPPALSANALHRAHAVATRELAIASEGHLTMLQQAVQSSEELHTVMDTMHVNVDARTDLMVPGDGIVSTRVHAPSTSGGGGHGDGAGVATGGISEYQTALADLEAIAQAQSSNGGFEGTATFYIFRLELTSADFQHVERDM